MNFTNKNFQYVDMDFEDFVRKASNGGNHGDDPEGTCGNGEDGIDQTDPDEWFYLRSLGSDPRRDVSDISEGFPELAPDFVAPPFVPDDAFFSSVFRIASPGMQVKFLSVRDFIELRRLKLFQPRLLFRLTALDSL